MPTPQLPSLPIDQGQPPLPAANTANNAKSPESCAVFANTYWTGYRCSCKVGFAYEPLSGECKKIGLNFEVNPIPNPQLCGPNEEWRDSKCQCLTRYYRGPGDKCLSKEDCGPNGQFNSIKNICDCDNGY